MNDERFDRNVRFFGKDGQESLQQTTVVVAGVGGLGSVVVQQVALLGFGSLFLVDPGELKNSGRNRYVTARHDDAVPGTKKVEIGKRLVHSINPAIRVETVVDSIISEQGFAAIKKADYVVGCLDLEGFRYLLFQACAIFQKPLIDVATQILPDDGTLRYGGRVVSSFFGSGCISCLDVLDRKEISLELASNQEVQNRDALYGVEKQYLAEDSGPSVAPLNGMIASLGVMELMAAVTGLRPPHPHLNFDGRTGKIGARPTRLTGTCYFCDGLFLGVSSANPGELLQTAAAMTVSNA